MAQRQEASSSHKDILAVDALRAALVDSDQSYYLFDHRYQGVKGTPFLSKVWQPADLRLENDKVVRNVPIKYDLISNNLLAMRRPNDSIILESGLVKDFTLHTLSSGLEPINRLYRRYAFQQGDKVLDAYFEVLTEGKDAALLKHTRKEIQHFNKELTSYSAQSGFDQIEDKIEYYVFSATGKAEPVKLSRKGLNKALTDLAVTPQSALAGSSSSIRSESELIEAFQQVAARPASR